MADESSCYALYEFSNRVNDLIINRVDYMKLKMSLKELCSNKSECCKGAFQITVYNKRLHTGFLISPDSFNARANRFIE